MPRIDISKPNILKIERGLAAELERLEQERDELKKACEKCKLFDIEKTNRDLLEQIEKLEQENKELMAEIESFMNGDYCANGCKKMNNAFCDAHTAIINENNKLRSALEEIRELAKNGNAIDGIRLKILDKINEVLNEA